MPNIPSIKIGNTTYNVKDTTAREHLVEVSTTQPSSPDNRLWIKDNADEYQIPTYEEFSGVKGIIDTIATYFDFINGQMIYYPEFDVAADYSTPLTKYEKVGNALIVAPCQKGDVFYVKGCGESSNRLWTVAQSDGTAIQTSTKNLDYSTLTKVEITWENAGYIVVNSKISVREAALIKADENLFSKIIVNDESDNNKIVSDSIESISGQRFYFPEYRKATIYSSPLTKFRDIDCSLIIAPCQKGDVFYVKGKGKSTSRLWTVSQSDGTLIQASQSNLTSNTFIRLEITWDDAAYLSVNSYYADVEPGLIKVNEELLPEKIYDQIIDDEKIVSESVKFITGQEFFYGEIDRASEYSDPMTKTYRAGSAMIIAPCQKGDVFYIKAAPTNSNIRPWTVCESDGTVIQTISPASTSYPTWTKFEITWDNAAYLVINSVYSIVTPGAIKVSENLLNGNLYTLAKGAKDTVDDLYTVVDTINNTLNESAIMQIKPEDFEGETLTDKVKNAVTFLNTCSGSCELYFGDSQTYNITEAITIPSNTKIIVEDCTIKLDDEVHDNIFRTANLIPDENDRNAICTCTRKLSNISIIGVGNAVISGPDHRYVGPTFQSDTPVEWVGDAYGWRGHATLFVGVNNFEISGLKYENCICWETVVIGCSYGKIHDISSDSGNKNNDMVDILTGSKFIDVYNLSGFSADDAVAIASLDNARANSGVTPPIYPCIPIGYEDYRFGEDTHDIRVNNICTIGTGGSTGHQLILLTGKNDVYNVFASNISDSGNKRAGLVKIYSTYLSTYTDGNIYNVFINDVECNSANKCLILSGMPHNSMINKLVINNGATAIDKTSSAPSYEQANTTVTNIVVNNS